MSLDPLSTPLTGQKSFPAHHSLTFSRIYLIIERINAKSQPGAHARPQHQPAGEPGQVDGTHLARGPGARVQAEPGGRFRPRGAPDADGHPLGDRRPFVTGWAAPDLAPTQR